MPSSDILKQFRKEYPDALAINVKTDLLWSKDRGEPYELPVKVWIVLPTGEVKITTIL